jgi:hypothetical protein
VFSSPAKPPPTETRSPEHLARSIDDRESRAVIASEVPERPDHRDDLALGFGQPDAGLWVVDEVSRQQGRHAGGGRLSGPRPQRPELDMAGLAGANRR